MSTGPIVTIDGHEVYYAGRPHRPLANARLPGNQPAAARRPAGYPPALPAAIWPIFALLTAGLIVLLAAILARRSRR